MKLLPKNFQKGFTLVELLIVIALIGILSVAVLATINPIEQSNKARDAKFKNDSAEVLSAYERYYATQNQYPWNATTNAVPLAAGNAGAYNSTNQNFGVLGAAAGTDGLLITTSELKSSFRGKEHFVNPTNADMLYMYTDGLDRNYVCFCPKANANKSGPSAQNLKCLDNTATPPVIGDVGDGTCAVAANPNVATFCDPSATVANRICVPEGDVN